ncbi:sorbitol dehydrogenase [Halarchaeum grantii]|uniref:L-threonine 3-dehydrogenase n=1 Tax=Halarchaeum grantii TaxID=1193105 RepID=A0A830F6S1_9EURY|nr:NAD(P)-dependent alcohol dehydrogenase [Halarchaeum grantii]GGL44739.1 sorbitol dehydrogenase [Halarchaeum grantii]
MRSVLLTDTNTFEHVTRERPDPDPDEALVRVTDVGICGSDVHYYEHGRIGDHVVEDPLVLGHESAGVVDAVGADVEGLTAGDRVAIEPGVPCRRCRFCTRGDYHLCPDVSFMATPPVDGAFAEYVAWPADYCHPLPESVSTREGALCEPLSVALHAAERGDVGVGDTVLVTGAGPIGLLVAEAVRAAGATDVVVTDVVPEKLARAEARGADATVNVAEEDLEARVRTYTDGDGVDVAIEASGAEPAVAALPDVVRRGGTAVLVGLPTVEEVPFDVHAVIDGELDVHGSFRFENTYPDAVSLLADGAVDVAGIVDFTEPLDRLDTAFERAQDPTTVKGMVRVADVGD